MIPAIKYSFQEEKLKSYLNDALLSMGLRFKKIDVNPFVINDNISISFNADVNVISYYQFKDNGADSQPSLVNILSPENDEYLNTLYFGDIFLSVSNISNASPCAGIYEISLSTLSQGVVNTQDSTHISYFFNAALRSMPRGISLKQKLFKAIYQNYTFLSGVGAGLYNTRINVNFVGYKIDLK